MKNKVEFVRFLKFLIVGIINTGITYIVYVLLRFLDLVPELCNVIGYIVGVVNSFIWNKKWVFQARSGNTINEFMSFIAVFVVCYAIQLYVFRTMLYVFFINEYLAQLIGMIVYTILNFSLNRIFSFKIR